ncbi:hypothetical protein C0J52_05694, partial [Blattella germanica]
RTWDNGICKSIRRVSTELQISWSVIHKILYKRLHLCAFLIQLRHYVKPNDSSLRAQFATEKLLRIENLDFFSGDLFAYCSTLEELECHITNAAVLMTPQMQQNT